MTTTSIVSVRAAVVEIKAWRAAASRLGVSFNAWARRALNDQVDLDLALLREEGLVSSTEEGSDGGRVG